MEKYTQIKRIGEGSFGKALLVKEKESGKYYVIKEINIQKMGRKERDDARKEVKVLSQMKHSNIVSYQESFEEGGKLYIAMDYCDGGDLYKKINDQKGKLFTEDQILDWFVQICLAIKHVHDRKILHRDIKSQNIFLMKNGIVKLGDFGIAKVLRNTQELARTCIGTPYYLSPEICENRPYNNKSDIWALGCVLYEMATLKHAFEAGNMRNLVIKIIRGSYPPISSRYSQDFKHLIDQMFKRQPQYRPSVNAILRMTFIQKRIEKFLSQTMIAEEFSHTVLHKNPVHVRAPLHPIRPQVDHVIPQQRSAAKNVVPAAPQKYDPGLIYGVKKPVNPKPAAEKRGVVLRPKPKPSDSPSAMPAARKPISGALAEKKRLIDERVKLQRDRMKQQDKQLAIKQQQLAARQKQARMNQARQAGWKNTLNSGEIGKYAGKHQPENKSELKREPENIPKKLDHDNQAEPTPVSVAVTKAEDDRQQASEAAKRAQVVEEYLLRKREAAAYRARGQQWLMGAAVNVPRPEKQRYEEARKPVVRDNAEKEYLAKLEAIRRQNYQERKRIQQRVALGSILDSKSKAAAEKKVEQLPPRPNLMLDPDYRKKKMAALKAQADEQSELLKKELAEKRKQVIAAINQPSPPPAAAGAVAAAAGPSPVAQRKAWDKPVMVQLPKQYDATTSVVQDTSTGVVFVRPEEEELNKQPRKAWDQAAPVGNLFGDRTFEGTTTRSVSRESEDDVLATGAPLIPVVSEAKPLPTEDIVTSVDKDVTKNVEQAVVDDVTKVIDDATKIVSDNVLVDKNTGKDGNVTKDITKSITEAPPLPLSSDKPPTVVTPSKAHDGSSDALSQRTPEENVQHDSQPDHLETAKDKPVAKEAWEAPATGAAEDKVQSTEDKRTVEGVNVSQVNEDLKVEDVEDERQEIMEYVAVLEEEEKEGKDEEEEEESFHTPEVSPDSLQLTQRLCSGKFDTHHTILRTCSLPDLRSLFATMDLSSSDDPSPSVSCHSSTRGGESGNESDDEELEEDDEQSSPVKEGEDNEDEDFQKLIQTLQDVIDDNKSNQLTSPKRPLPISLFAASNSETVFAEPADDDDDEEWEDSESEQQGPSWHSKKKGSASSDEGSVFARLEETRAELESQLGMDVFMEAYSECQLLQDEESEDISDNTLQKMTAIIGEKNQQYTIPLLHLVIADSAYCDANRHQAIGDAKRDDVDGDDDYDEGTHEP